MQQEQKLDSGVCEKGIRQLKIQGSFESKLGLMIALLLIGRSKSANTHLLRLASCRSPERWERILFLPPASERERDQFHSFYSV